MLTHRQQEFTPGNHFSFSNSIQKPDIDQKNSEDIEYGRWAERIKGKFDYFGKPDDRKFGAWTRRASKNNSNSEAEFKRMSKADDEDSDVSPPLWKKPGSPLIHSAGSSPVRNNSYYHGKDSRIQYSARAQTIARYRQEMLDLVRDMPENAYELSLRDLVESPKITMPLKETAEDKSEEEKDEKKKNKKMTAKKEKRRVSRSESMTTGGFMLNMFIPRRPAYLGGRKSDSGSSGTCAKVSPKPVLGDGEKGRIEKRTDEEWWNKESEEMSSSINSSASSSSSGRRSREMRGCYSFFRTHKSRSTGF